MDTNLNYKIHISNNRLSKINFDQIIFIHKDKHFIEEDKITFYNKHLFRF